MIFGYLAVLVLFIWLIIELSIKSIKKIKEAKKAWIDYKKAKAEIDKILKKENKND
jgi:hypothetical protein